jgi:hypothetical protein
MPPKAAAIPNEAFRPQPSSTQLIAQDIHSFMRSEAWNGMEWNGINSRNARIVRVVKFAQTQCNITLDNRILTDIFQLIAPHVHEM